MRIRRGVICLADFDPRLGTESGKARPILVMQTDLLNEAEHPTSWILPCTTRLAGENLLPVPLPRVIAGNREDCEAMIDRSRTIDNRRFVRELKLLPALLMREVEEKLRRLAEL